MHELKKYIQRALVIVLCMILGLMSKGITVMAWEQTYDSSVTRPGYHLEATATKSCHHDASDINYIQSNMSGLDPTYDELWTSIRTTGKVTYTNPRIEAANGNMGIGSVSGLQLVVDIPNVGHQTHTYVLAAPYYDAGSGHSGYAYYNYNFAWCDKENTLVLIGSSHHWLGSTAGNVGENEVHNEDVTHNIIQYDIVPNSYTVTLNPNGGVSSPNGSSVTVTYTQESNNAIGTYRPTRTGYRFNGWDISAAGGSQIFNEAGACTNEGTYWSNNRCNFIGDYTVYAKWERSTYNIAYIGNEQDAGADFVDYDKMLTDDYIMFDNDGENQYYTKSAVVSFQDSLTNETINEDTTKTVVGWSFAADNNQDAMYPLGTTINGLSLYNAAAAAGDLTMDEPKAAYNTYPTGTDGSEQNKPEDISPDYVNLYAVWDCGAVIEAYDLYYTLQQAQAGEITEEELLRHARAIDAEAVTANNMEGYLEKGEDAQLHTSFIVEDYQAEEFQNFRKEGSLTETYLVKDCAGNITRKQITVYLVDTAPGDASDVSNDSTIRFVSEAYLDTFSENSVWKKEDTYRQKLCSVLGVALEERTF